MQKVQFFFHILYYIDLSPAKSATELKPNRQNRFRVRNSVAAFAIAHGNSGHMD
ncbi:hypothetical protein [Gorillibacterium massiliense]|uniref:hypothetical protein n=1 Tax=Gorillibacterium massiliense TaxID=1280390 RepID=UPI001EE2056E|nr:hypothetical protein [Gorillibacterium massiliense]